MEITSRGRAGVRILQLRGKLGSGPGEGPLHDAVRTALDQGATKLLIVLQEVPVIDSGAVGQLVASLMSAKRRGGDLKLLSPSPRAEDILRITDLIKLFEVYQDEDEALASFA